MAGAYLLVRTIPGSQQSEFDLVAEPGKTTIGLQTRPDEISPGCGCLSPEFGHHPWVGMSVPSASFDLDVTAKGGVNIDRGLWSLTMMQPDVAPTDWYAPPVESIRTRIVLDRHGATRQLFSGRTTHLVIWSDKKIGVEQSRTNPYAAVLPAAGGQTSFFSQEASRARWGGVLGISTGAPERPRPCSGYSQSPNPECAQRGPMVDLLGPTEHFTLPITKRLRLWTGMREVRGFEYGGMLHISVTTPFSLRLYAHPVQVRWERNMPEEWNRLHASQGSLTKEERREMKLGPLEQGRFIMTEPLPAYHVRLSSLSAPRPSEWRAFVRRSAKKEIIAPMLREGSADRGHLVVGDYALPPVTSRPQILVFGKLADFESSSVRGRAVVGSTIHPITRGELLHFESGQGIGAGVYHATPLISDGLATQRSSVSGPASIWLDGEVVTHPPWLPWVPVGALVGALVGLLVTAGANWVKGTDDDLDGGEE